MLRHLPNFICLVRIALIWPTVVALNRADYWQALVLVSVCAISDGLDGWLAKRFNWTSHLGKMLDPLADKLMITAAYIILVAYTPGIVKPWIAILVIAIALVIFIVMRMR